MEPFLAKSAALCGPKRVTRDQSARIIELLTERLGDDGQIGTCLAVHDDGTITIEFTQEAQAIAAEVLWGTTEIGSHR